MQRTAFWLGTVLIVACGGNTSRTAENASSAGAETESASTAPAQPGVIRRSELHAVLGRGPGYFLQRLETEAVQEDGRFRGFRVTRFVDEAFFANAGFLVGDVVVAINQHSVERPEEAFAVWEELRAAPSLVVRVVRNGTQRDLVFPIVD